MKENRTGGGDLFWSRTTPSLYVLPSFKVGPKLGRKKKEKKNCVVDEKLSSLICPLALLFAIARAFCARGDDDDAQRRREEVGRRRPQKHLSIVVVFVVHYYCENDRKLLLFFFFFFFLFERANVELQKLEGRTLW